ncbi:hypothetical protein CJF42_00725 [Pseudoalteromonas sp. NBT06-2]|uniref:prolipoprotein diacylglyceryl transferase n=1 Tax=Pseudoalteromonas sp. NBT06-2 TaxID=2025950 RepID=UPI000BA4EE20|nr:prolipoprotein diacylglyceryl transferase [Pseudoalteromonas sp. NBT06-2]PAJ76248.1 hypothetical protein CJF42_00725 [Pseudoalteromonas sp. NBT06-2]
MSYPYLESVLLDFTGIDTGTQFIPMFGLLVISALLISLHFGKKKLAQLNLKDLDGEYFETTIFYAFVGGLLGAKLLHVFEFREYGITEQLFSRGGFSIYGGLILGFITAIFMLKRKKIAILPTTDIVAPYLMLAYGIGRIGCQISGDGDWGQKVNMAAKPSWLPDWFWTQTYDNNVAGQLIQAPGVYPTPMYETLLAFISFFLLRACFKYKASAVGFTFAMYLMLSAVNRFMVEFIRINPRYDVLGFELSQSQIISLVVLSGGLFFLVKSLKQNK